MRRSKIWNKVYTSCIIGTGYGTYSNHIIYLYSISLVINRRIIHTKRKTICNKSIAMNIVCIFK